MGATFVAFSCHSRESAGASTHRVRAKISAIKPFAPLAGRRSPKGGMRGCRWRQRKVEDCSGSRAKLRNGRPCGRPSSGLWPPSPRKRGEGHKWPNSPSHKSCACPGVKAGIQCEMRCGQEKAEFSAVGALYDTGLPFSQERQRPFSRALGRLQPIIGCGEPRDAEQAGAHRDHDPRPAGRHEQFVDRIQSERLESQPRS